MKWEGSFFNAVCVLVGPKEKWQHAEKRIIRGQNVDDWKIPLKHRWA